MIMGHGRAKEIRLYAIKKEVPVSSASVRTQPTPTNGTAHGNLRKKGTSGKVSPHTISIDEFLNTVKNYSIRANDAKKQTVEKTVRATDEKPVAPDVQLSKSPSSEPNQLFANKGIIAQKGQTVKTPYAIDHDLLCETVEAIDKTPLEENLGKLIGAENLKGLDLWLLEPPRISPAAGILHREKAPSASRGSRMAYGDKRSYSALGAATAVRRVRRGFALGEAGSPSG